MLRLKTLLFVSVLFYGCQTRKLPSFITPCSLNDAAFDNCIIREMEKLRPRLPAGLPEMHIPKMEPLRVESANLESGNDLIVNFNNMDIYGLTAFKLIGGQFDIKNNFVKIDLVFDKLWSEGDYKVKGKLLVFNLNGGGRVNGTLQNTKVTATLKGKRQITKGKEYVIFDKIDIELDILDGATLYFDNIFENNEELTRATNAAIKENIVEILAEFKPVIRKTVGDIVLSFLGSLFRRYSIDELFPES